MNLQDIALAKPQEADGSVTHVQQYQVVDYLLPLKTVEKLSGLSRATIYRLIKSGKFPRPLSIGTGSVRWRQSDVIAWQQSLSPNSWLPTIGGSKQEIFDGIFGGIF
jgi:prophage regulatory protein